MFLPGTIKLIIDEVNYRYYCKMVITIHMSGFALQFPSLLSAALCKWEMVVLMSVFSLRQTCIPHFLAMNYDTKSMFRCS